MYFALKTVITAFIIAGISVLAQRYSLLAAALASLPLVSILAFVWIYIDTKDTQKIMMMSYDIFWLVLPSLVFFLIFPLLLKHGFHFSISLLLACMCMAILYGVMTWLLKIVA